MNGCVLHPFIGEDDTPRLILPTHLPAAKLVAHFPERHTSCYCKNMHESASTHTAAKAAFLEAYDAYADSIFRFALGKTSDRDLAHDLTQETYTKVWEYCAKGNVIEQWRPFLFRTVRNMIIDHYRKKRHTSLEALAEDEGFEPEDPATASQIDDAEAHRVHRAILALPDPSKEVLLLRFIEDMPVKEIALILNCSENVVSVRIHRGLAQLRKHIRTDE